MKELLLKDYKLSFSKFFLFSPILFSALLLIPNWIYIIAFMYLFWLIAPGTFSEINVQNDFTFTQLLPVSKKDIVKSKIFAFLSIELFHIFGAIIFTFINHQLYGKSTIFFNLNFAFFGNILIMYSIYNILFFPRYFKTAFFYGKTMTFSTIIASIYAIGIECLNIFVKPVNHIFESKNNILIQIGILLFGIIIFICTSIIAINKSIKNFEVRQ